MDQIGRWIELLSSSRSDAKTPQWFTISTTGRLPLSPTPLLRCAAGSPPTRGPPLAAAPTVPRLSLTIPSHCGRARQGCSWFRLGSGCATCWIEDRSPSFSISLQKRITTIPYLGRNLAFVLLLPTASDGGDGRQSDWALWCLDDVGRPAPTKLTSQPQSANPTRKTVTHQQRGPHPSTRPKQQEGLTNQGA
jgi:hypothetical protein